MKLLKKLIVAMALVAVCISAVPVTANAAINQNEICFDHDFCIKINERYRIVNATSHPYSYLMDVDRDGVCEIVVDSCTVITQQNYYDLRLNHKFCGI